VQLSTVCSQSRELLSKAASSSYVVLIAVKLRVLIANFNRVPQFYIDFITIGFIARGYFE